MSDLLMETVFHLVQSMKPLSDLMKTQKIFFLLYIRVTEKFW